MGTVTRNYPSGDGLPGSARLRWADCPAAGRCPAAGALVLRGTLPSPAGAPVIGRLASTGHSCAGRSPAIGRQADSPGQQDPPERDALEQRPCGRGEQVQAGGKRQKDGEDGGQVGQQACHPGRDGGRWWGEAGALKRRATRAASHPITASNRNNAANTAPERWSGPVPPSQWLPSCAPNR